MKEVVKVLLVVGILLVTFGLPVMLQLMTTKNTTSTTNSGKTTEVAQQSLKFVSEAPVLAIKGGQYIYQPSLVSSEGDTISISVLEMPSWLKWNAESKSIVGQVPFDINTFSLTIEAESTSGQKVQQAFTVSVENAQSVQGATDSRDAVDPFHPDVTVTPEISSVVTVVTVVPTTIAVTEAVYPTQSEVLGATSVAPAALNIPYLAAAILLLLVAGVLSVKLWSLLFSKSRLNGGGIVIERGRV
jgi:hypothetical protein